MAADGIEVVLFDLGGVLVELHGVGSMRELTGIDSDDELWRRWLGCPWVRSFERGACSAGEFAAGVVDDWGLTVEPEAFLDDHFSRWPLMDTFDFGFLSYELGLLKPDQAIFDRVAQLVAAPPGRILFLDDNRPNVDGAIAAGFAAAHVHGVAEAQEALLAAGVLAP